MAKFDLDQSIVDNLKRGDRVNFILKDDEILALLDVLSFAHDTAKFVIELEKTKGTPGGIEKLTRYLKNSEQLVMRVYAAIGMMGKPNDDLLN